MGAGRYSVRNAIGGGRGVYDRIRSLDKRNASMAEWRLRSLHLARMMWLGKIASKVHRVLRSTRHYEDRSVPDMTFEAAVHLAREHAVAGLKQFPFDAVLQATLDQLAIPDREPRTATCAVFIPPGSIWV